MTGRTFYRPTGGRFLYGNVILREIWPDEAGGTLLLKVLYAERELQTIVYRGVYAGQFGPAQIGARILIAEEVPLRILSEPYYRQAAAQLFSSRNPAAPEFIFLLQRLGNRLFRHYLDSQPECMVIARDMRIHPQTGG
ncbi:hypothetical protein M7775_22020 [Sporomusa sphaeroides DSM 2875]|uniref:hypothetical protein n=1 Tax=Sporomusa sphaeroides TaxID=47679 RepID=UPI00202F0E81|nr:hypothetical protein [Sporomusa sphaeroides]MCM0761230.1 hypothetical protein [Sporomusa sphaeroides DSM 2875]